MDYNTSDYESRFVPEKKEKLITALFAIFLGAFGVHHFYLGKKGLGFVYLLFCWTFLPGLVAFVEGIYFLIMDKDEFDYKYNLGVDMDQSSKRRAYSPKKYFQEEAADPYEGKISIADEIEKLHDLMVRGIISEREFAERKDRL
ncbi:MAG: NINE protein [Aureispira sp.]